MRKKFINSVLKILICLPLVFYIIIASGCSPKEQPAGKGNSENQTKAGSTLKTEKSGTANTATTSAAVKSNTKLINLEEKSTYENIAEGIKISYPKAWKKKNGEKGKYIVAFEGTKESANDYAEDMIISVEDITGKDITLESYTNQILQSVKADEDFKLLKSEAFKQGDTPVQRIIYTYPDPNIDRKIAMYGVFAIKNNKLYEVSMTCAADEFDDIYGPAYEDIISSLEIK